MKNNINIYANTLITFDISGTVNIDGPNRFINYDSSLISLQSGKRIIYIYGNDLKITTLNKNNISISGNIEKIELSEEKHEN